MTGVPPLRRSWLRRLGWGLVFLLVVPDLVVTVSARGRIFRTPATVPEGRVALVLGTSSMMTDGRANLFYRTRIEAAAVLYLSGRTQRLILSGTTTANYSEPDVMRKDLRLLGVPDDVMELDGKGFRTLDSVLRVKQVFKADQVVIVSQKFHLERALFLARAFGIDACGYVADDRETLGSFVKIRGRDVIARLRAVLDATVLKRIVGSATHE